MSDLSVDLNDSRFVLICELSVIVGLVLGWWIAARYPEVIRWIRRLFHIDEIDK